MNDRSQEFTNNMTASNKPLKKIDRVGRISAQELHKYVMGAFGIFILFVITYAIAMSRVARQEKFALSKSHLKSLTLEYKQIAVAKD